MFDYIFKNKEWIFSGIGVLLISFLWTWMTRKKRKGEMSGSKSVGIHDSSFQESVVNNVTGEHVQLLQTIFQSEPVGQGLEDKPIFVAASPELTKAKVLYNVAKRKRRTAIYATIIHAAKSFPDSPLEIRHILDGTEDLINAQPKEILTELKEMVDEQIITFLLTKENPMLSPYTSISLTKKFYATIPDIEGQF